MAIYHQHIKPIQRSKGKSAVAAVAYRSGKKMTDNRTGEVHDFSHKKGVSFQSIIGWLDTREALWNAAEQAENRKDATTAREYEVSIPWELDEYQQQQLVTQYGFWLHEEYSVAVDINVHNAASHNPHAHILTTTRMVENERTLTDKSPREWSGSRREKHGLTSRKVDLIAAREKWAQLSNAALKDAGHDERIDHRSYSDQGILIPPQIHMGVHALAEYKKTGCSDRVEKNDKIIAQQKKARELLDEKDLLERKVNYLKNQNFLSTIENTHGKYLEKTSKESEQIELNEWGFPASDNQAIDEMETEWLSPDDAESADIEHLYEDDSYMPDSNEPHQ
mgnify:CR=1 FL=1